MTENSDSGFTEINQTGSSDISQHAKSKTPSPEPDLRRENLSGESSVPVDLKSLDKHASSSRSVSKSSGSNSGSSSSDDDDSDDDDYDGGKPSVLNWVSYLIQLHLTFAKFGF